MPNDLRIILTGFSGTGKTAVGRRVARVLGWEFIDTDELVVQRVGKSIERIFTENGEDAFRSHERMAVAHACSLDRVIISSGGGAIINEENRLRMLEAGLVVCLEGRPETIYARLAKSNAVDSDLETRPLLNAEGQDSLELIEVLKAQRQWAYALAHWTVTTDTLSIEQAVHEVIRAWRRFGASAHIRKDPQIAAVVTTDSSSYPVVVGWDILENQLGPRLLDSGFAGRAFIICDEGALHPYGRAAQRSLHQAGVEVQMFTFPAGEISKTLSTAKVIYEWMANKRIERNDAIVAVGGGVCGDLAGFVASTYLRGIQFVQVPTTLLAMVDASIGGKVAVDLPAGKNLVGAFHHPLLVLADAAALTTLPVRVVREGWAEALKHGFAFDARLVDLYESHVDALLNLEPELTAYVVAWNAAIKARVVTGDERETSGLRTLLNYGHTIGHAVETASGYSHYLHGEAVAVGMRGAAELGYKVGVTPAEVVVRQAELIDRFGLPGQIKGVDVDLVLDAMTRDKKVVAGEISWVFLESMGHAALHRGVSQQDANQAVRALTAEENA